MFKENTEINNDKCLVKIPNILAAEDIKTYKNIIILSSSDKVNLFALSYDLHNLTNGALYAIYPPFDYKTIQLNA